MKKTIAILALAALGITTVNAGVHFGISFGIPAPAVVVATPPPVVVAPAPVLVAPAPVVVAPAPVVVQPPMPAPYVEVVPACPTPGFIWVGGSWGWSNNHWVWTRGHWGAPAHWGHGYRADYHWAHGHH